MQCRSWDWRIPSECTNRGGGGGDFLYPIQERRLLQHTHIAAVRGCFVWTEHWGGLRLPSPPTFLQGSTSFWEIWAPPPPTPSSAMIMVQHTFLGSIELWNPDCRRDLKGKELCSLSFVFVNRKQCKLCTWAVGPLLLSILAGLRVYLSGFFLLWKLAGNWATLHLGML